MTSPNDRTTLFSFSLSCSCPGGAAPPGSAAEVSDVGRVMPCLSTNADLSLITSAGSVARSQRGSSPPQASSARPRTKVRFLICVVHRAVATLVVLSDAGRS